MGAVPPPGPAAGRVIDALLGGHSHYPADREAACQVRAAFPAAPRALAEENEFTLRAARWAAARGISRLVHAGWPSYLPGRNIHVAAQAVLPSAQVVYVSSDPDMHADVAALLGTLPGCEAALGGPAGLLDVPAVAAMAAGGPVAVMLPLVLSFTPGPEAARLAQSLAAGLPAGSCLAISVILPGGPRGREAAAVYPAAPIMRRSRQEVASWLDGMDIARPGVADVRLIPGRGWGEESLPARQGGHIAGVAAVAR
jgi:hypothetical protein